MQYLIVVVIAGLAIGILLRFRYCEKHSEGNLLAVSEERINNSGATHVAIWLGLVVIVITMVIDRGDIQPSECTMLATIAILMLMFLQGLFAMIAAYPSILDKKDGKLHRNTAALKVSFELAMINAVLIFAFVVFSLT